MEGRRGGRRRGVWTCPREGLPVKVEELTGEAKNGRSTLAVTRTWYLDLVMLGACAC